MVKKKVDSPKIACIFFAKIQANKYKLYLLGLTKKKGHKKKRTKKRINKEFFIFSISQYRENEKNEKMRKG